MGIIVDRFIVSEETYLKTKILSSGVVFSDSALDLAKIKNAKEQNLVYNMPLGAEKTRPQELFIENIIDGYITVCSCVAETGNGKPVVISTVDTEELIALVDGNVMNNVRIRFVKKPEYYNAILDNGESVTKYITSCGYDELNIIPWKGCAISKGCRFCGINNFLKANEVSAFSISSDYKVWENYQKSYLESLKKALTIAMKDECYSEHMHLILIAGNLCNDKLDYESRIFCEIAKEINCYVNEVATEGIVLVISPPQDINILKQLKESGVSKVVFNLEATNIKYFKKYCPGKADLGYNYFIERLETAISIFGVGNVWSNLVLGLEPQSTMLDKCRCLAKKGIVISANVLHLDKGNSLDCKVPEICEIFNFFYELEKINFSNGLVPYYCSCALRTSLSNETHDGRITLWR